MYTGVFYCDVIRYCTPQREQGRRGLVTAGLDVGIPKRTLAFLLAAHACTANFVAELKDLRYAEAHLFDMAGRP